MLIAQNITKTDDTYLKKKIERKGNTCVHKPRSHVHERAIVQLLTADHRNVTFNMPGSHIHERPAKMGYFFVLASSVTIHSGQ